LKKISDKRAKQLREYAKLREAYLRAFPSCAVCGIEATDIHHKAGRSGDRLNDTSNFLAVCRACHSKIELNPTWAKVKGYSKSRLSDL
jgi:hypothetical protein